MNKDNHLIFEEYHKKRYLTVNESFQKDKDFFNYVIENNNHLSFLKTYTTKKLFNTYISTLVNRINDEAPGLIRESNMSDSQAFSILNEATQTVTDQEAYDAVKDIFEEIAVKQLIRKADLFLEADGDPNELVNRPMARRPGQRDAQGRMLPGQGAAQVQNQAQRDRVAGKMRDLRAANQIAAARIAELEAKIQEMEAAEANMNQQQKAQSDSIQDQLSDMIKQIQNTNTNTMTGPTINIGGYGAPQAAPAATPSRQSAPATSQPSNSKTPAAATSQPNTPKKPGILSKIGSAVKKYALNPNTLGILGGAAGAALGGGPLGGAIGGAIGKGLGRAFNTRGSIGTKLGAGVGGAISGGLTGAGVGYGVDAAGDYLSGIDQSSMPSDVAQPGQSWDYDDVNSTGMPSDVAQPGVPIGGSPAGFDYSDTYDENNPEYMPDDDGAQYGKNSPVETSDNKRNLRYKNIPRGATRLRQLQ